MFTLNGVISKEEIRDLFIPDLIQNLVATFFLNLNTVKDAESIKIPGVGDVKTNKYTGEAVTTAATDESKLLVLDNADYFQKSIDKVDNEQSAIKIINKVLSKGASSMAEVIDKFFFKILAGALNSVSGVALSDTNITTFIASMSVKLTKLKASKKGRRLTLTPEAAALLSEANVAFNTSTAEEAAREGFVGRFGGFDIFESINLFSPDFDVLNETDIPTADTLVVINSGYAGVSSGTAVLVAATNVSAPILYVEDGTDETAALAAQATAELTKTYIAGVQDSTEGGIGFQEYNVGEPTEGFKWIAKGLSNYGAVIAQQGFVVKSECTIA